MVRRVRLATEQTRREGQRKATVWQGGLQDVEREGWGDTGDSEQAADVRGCGVLQNSPGSNWMGRETAHMQSVDEPTELTEPCGTQRERIPSVAGYPWKSFPVPE